MRQSLRVLLVHGLGRSPVSTWGLARHLRRAGLETEDFAYLAAIESFEHIRSRLAQRLARLAQSGPYAVIGHSLGGLLLRSALPGIDPAPEHFVMLATPNQPPRLARRMRRFWPFRVFAGDAGRRLADAAFYRSLPVPTVPYTIVAGTAGPRGRWSPFGDDVNDWLVAVDETRIHAQDQPLLLPVEHTFMMAYTRVRVAVASALMPR